MSNKAIESGYNHHNHKWVSGINANTDRKAAFASERNKNASLVNIDEVSGYRGFGALQMIRLLAGGGVSNNAFGA